MLILISGLPGSGKSTLARAFAERYDAVHLNTDMVRNRSGLRGHYSPEDKKQVYDALLEQARYYLSKGQNVIVDSTFYLNSIRTPFEEAAILLNRPIFRVEVRAAEETIRQRLKHPRPDSEADFAVYKKIQREYQPWTAPYLMLWTDEMTIEALVEALHEYITGSHDQ